MSDHGPFYRSDYGVYYLGLVIIKHTGLIYLYILYSLLNEIHLLMKSPKPVPNLTHCHP
ncbi:hypothetical protein HanIR_Chr15g0743141 [Helianthus annuus]|nr:hypothetical protein HanIR_Chr15g0743141 [Helianthus annuus]